MHAQKHEVLSRLTPALRARIQAAAVAYQVTVDDVVRAGLRRVGSSARAVQAAQRVEQEASGAFALLGGWPESCAFCLDILSAPHEVCAFCNALGCGECVRGEGCPRCQAAARETRAKALAAKHAREREERAVA